MLEPVSWLSSKIEWYNIYFLVNFSQKNMFNTDYKVEAGIISVIY